MNIIVNVNKSWGIGKDGDLLCHLKDDMVYFKDMTMGNTVIYGRKTLESFPGGRPLPGRKNIVITSDFDNLKPESIHGAYYFGSVNKVIADPGNKSDTSNSRFMIIRDQVIDDPKYKKCPSNTSLFAVKTIQDAVMLANMIELKTENIFICGGESIYMQSLYLCKYAFVTINDCKKEAYSFFPNLYERENWEPFQKYAPYTMHYQDDILYQIGIIFRNKKLA